MQAIAVSATGQYVAYTGLSKLYVSRDYGASFDMIQMQPAATFDLGIAMTPSGSKVLATLANSIYING